MNYEDMSYMQINKRVARALNLDWNAVASDGLIIDGRSLSVNYCNNPSDAWPIIVENGISIDFWGDSWGADIQLDGEVAFEHLDKNPLLAAMICFLKMKDAEK